MDEHLRELARYKMDCGELPAREPMLAESRPSAGERCALCGSRLPPGGFELTLYFDRERSLASLSLHMHCYNAWAEEHYGSGEDVYDGPPRPDRSSQDRPSEYP